MDPVLNSGDTAWLLISTALVMLMTVPGVALFYGGLTKKVNVLNTMFMSLIAFSITSIIWVLYGYQFAFGEDMLFGIIGNPVNLLFNGIGVDQLSTLATTVPETVFIAFQMTFAAITVALISGAVVERMKVSSWMVFIAAWVSLVYVPIAHWVWGGGFLAQLGALDFAGGTVVHINSGVAALALILLLGKRKDTKLLPHQLGYSIIGAGLLWFGWFGFNAGSALTAGGLAGSAFIVTNTAAAAAMISWVIIDYLKTGKPTVLGAISGAIAGLVAITPAAGFVTVQAAVIIGLITSVISYFAISYLKPKLGYDDALDVVGIHGMSGLWGALATGLFAAPFVNELGTGLFYGNPGQLLTQIVAVVVVAAYSFVATLVIGKIIDIVMGLRVDDKEEIEGLDITQHEETGYRI
ncbi:MULTISPECIES: ammonium transporter [Methanobacterium]|jgi:Amt family ammonium transporter|uniref:Ammonium transporter n=2 Tax=Methanobacterium subterraneum TaxID=59277 RepID=A0A2H4VCP0_9EURY|nr:MULTISPECIES: ammonium transporter [Methanobacterium]MBW4258033.1 ammonium transporter [Methanobacterium sp. YSL]PKL71731.1 MAG: ammonia channel protein [Methanobacteriales archaeon HGW-Methanobacteriales-2]AUB55841.1 ammonia channel protein [Methanobacterium subterraneum]AUB57150.1 ammonia channel protein [Methanobacterium sp. MZ-A1]NMO08494.1 ammonium transporter [Methanobacterium subterraneum]